MVNDEDDVEPTASTASAGPRPAPSSRPGCSESRTAIEGPRTKKVAIVSEYSGDPPFSDPILMRLDPDAPADSIVLIRRPRQCNEGTETTDTERWTPSEVR